MRAYSNGIGKVRSARPGGAGESATPLPDATILLHFEGATGTWVDASANAKAVTVYGVTSDNTTFKFGTSSAQGSNSFASGVQVAGDSTFYTLGSAGWCIDFWYFLSSTSTAGTANVLSFGSPASSPIFVGINKNGAAALGRLVVTLDNDAEQVIDVADVVPKDAWAHIAFTNDGTTTRAFVNGTVVGQKTYVPTLASSPLNVCGVYFNSGMFAGNRMDECRLVIGSSVWADTFTPPTSSYT